ncbi:hypothetical protein F2P81_026053 [Scophthalmus maximus]|uniref:Uncharacterized protein n=1 Tax=Scophthalmus maximus TaxID=52904 RepID=A0A6A4RMY5_SCOMX|nr:hypothetical protein F2P81_026053 [Scophthalmus maximus]
MKTKEGATDITLLLLSGKPRSSSGKEETRTKRGGIKMRPEDGHRGARSTLGNAGGRCLRCEAHDAHCKSVAENYRRTLNTYTKTVSELMLGFKTVLERYPELRFDTGDERLHCMVQAALGRNALVREMVRLAARRGHAWGLPGLNDSEEYGEERPRRPVVASVCEALNSCYKDGEALRLILERYTDLYVRYMEVW